MRANQSRAKIRCRALSKSTASTDEVIATSSVATFDISDADDELEGSGSQADTDDGTKRLIDRLRQAPTRLFCYVPMLNKLDYENIVNIDVSFFFERIENRIINS